MKEIEFNGTKITIDEDNITTVVNITTPNAKVIVNNNVVYEKYDSIYGFVPEPLREYLYNQNPYGTEENEKDISIEYGNDITFYIPKNKRKEVHVRFDLIDDMNYLISDYVNNVGLDKNIVTEISKILKQKWNVIINTCKDVGYQFKFSHSMGERYYGWWDVIFSISEWNKDKFETVVKVIDDFDTYLRSIEDKYNF